MMLEKTAAKNHQKTEMTMRVADLLIIADSCNYCANQHVHLTNDREAVGEGGLEQSTHQLQHLRQGNRTRDTYDCRVEMKQAAAGSAE